MIKLDSGSSPVVNFLPKQVPAQPDDRNSVHHSSAKPQRGNKNSTLNFTPQKPKMELNPQSTANKGQSAAKQVNFPNAQYQHMIHQGALRFNPTHPGTVQGQLMGKNNVPVNLVEAAIRGQVTQKEISNYNLRVNGQHTDSYGPSRSQIRRPQESKRASGGNSSLTQNRGQEIEGSPLTQDFRKRNL